MRSSTVAGSQTTASPLPVHGLPIVLYPLQNEMVMKIGVVGHHSRGTRALRLIERVNADCFNIDDGSLGCMLNHRRVWGYLESRTAPDDWGLVLEDDAEPVPNFRAQAGAALARVPNGVDVVSFYLGTGRPKQWMDDHVPQAVAAAKREDAHWILADVVIHGVAVAIRGMYIPKMLLRTMGSRRPLDEAQTQWCRRFGHDVAYTWPSLVNHADVPTIIVNHADHAVRLPGRVAWLVGGRDYWTSRAVVL